MPFIRISVMEPKPGQSATVSALLDELVALYQRQPGCLANYRLEHREGTGIRLGRVGIWSTIADAERAASADHDLALRSRLNQLVEPDTHEEFTFDAVGGRIPVAA